MSQGREEGGNPGVTDDTERIKADTHTINRIVMLSNGLQQIEQVAILTGLGIQTGEIASILEIKSASAQQVQWGSL
jgi:hypothetical protein